MNIAPPVFSQKWLVHGVAQLMADGWLSLNQQSPVTESDVASRVFSSAKVSVGVFRPMTAAGFLASAISRAAVIWSDIPPAAQTRLLSECKRRIKRRLRDAKSIAQ